MIVKSLPMHCNGLFAALFLSNQHTIMNVFLSPLQDLAAVRGAVRAGPAVRVLVVAHPRARRQPVRLLAEVRLSPHHPRQQRHLRRILLHLIDRVSKVERYRRLPFDHNLYF